MLLRTSLEKRVITYFAPCDPRQGMGGGARVEHMVTALERLGQHITIVSYDGSGELSLAHENISARTTIVKVSIPARVPKVMKSLAVPALVLLGLIYTRKNELVITHSPGVCSGLIGLLVCQVRRGRLIVDLTDAKDKDTPRAVYEQVLRSASVVFAVSHRLEGVARRSGARCVVHLPTFLDMSRFSRETGERETTRTSLGFSQFNKVIGYFGSFARIEGLPILLEAFSTVSREVPEAKLLIVGSRNVEGTDDIWKIIRDLHLADRVILLPAQPYAEVPKMLQAVDLLVAPKIQAPENEVADPIKVYEYLASGTPCIISSISEVAFMAQQAEAAFLVETGNAGALSDTILRVFANGEEAGRYAARGRRLVESSYSIERATDLIGKTLSAQRSTEPLHEEAGIVA
jgi:glycosyltransferase involved in cell wall biosynthesis